MDSFKLINTNDIPTTATTQTAQTSELRHEMMYNFKCRYRRDFYLKSGTAREQFRENETGNGLVPFHNNSQNCHNETQERGTHTITSCNRDNIPPSTTTAPQIVEVFVRDENTKKFFAFIFHCGQKKLDVAMVFENNQLIDNLVD